MMKIALFAGGNSLQFCHNAVQYLIYVKFKIKTINVF